MLRLVVVENGFTGVCAEILLPVVQFQKGQNVNNTDATPRKGSSANSVVSMSKHVLAYFLDVALNACDLDILGPSASSHPCEDPRGEDEFFVSETLGLGIKNGALHNQASLDWSMRYDIFIITSRSLPES